MLWWADVDALSSTDTRVFFLLSNQKRFVCFVLLHKILLNNSRSLSPKWPFLVTSYSYKGSFDVCLLLLRMPDWDNFRYTTFEFSKVFQEISGQSNDRSLYYRNVWVTKLHAATQCNKICTQRPFIVHNDYHFPFNISRTIKHSNSTCLTVSTISKPASKRSSRTKSHLDSKRKSWKTGTYWLERTDTTNSSPGDCRSFGSVDSLCDTLCWCRPGCLCVSLGWVFSSFSCAGGWMSSEVFERVKKEKFIRRWTLNHFSLLVEVSFSFPYFVQRFFYYFFVNKKKIVFRYCGW